jgi:hypothetical protein
MKPIKEAIKNIVDNHTTYADGHPIDIDFDELTTELCKKLESMYNIVEGAKIKIIDPEFGNEYVGIGFGECKDQILQKFNKELKIEE